ncbi:MAG: protein translocase subunit SecF [Candidatus Woesearchaeota archaeon]
MGGKQLLEKLISFYDNNHRKLIIIPAILLVFALVQISYQTATKGDFINRGITLKGGVTITIPSASISDIETLRNTIKTSFPQNEINLRTISVAGEQSGIVIESDFELTDEKSVNRTVDLVSRFAGTKTEDYSVEGIGSSLSSSFFKEVAFALLLAFLFMSIVVVITFRTPIPSAAVILSAFADIIVTVAIINLTGMKLGAGAIAAFLMLIGYSVDSNILLTAKVIRTKEGSFVERVHRALRTGLMMTGTTLAAVTVAIILSQSDTIRQIMIILVVGLIVDLFNTWITNVTILRWYTERK